MAPAIGGALIGAGTGIGSGIISGMYNSAEANRARNFADSSMDKEHNWALMDWANQNLRDDQVWNRQNDYNLKMWNMQNAYNMGLWNQQNEYNSPKAMMQRYKDAGLNANLIYGQSNMGGTISTANLDGPAPMRASMHGAGHSSPSFGHGFDASGINMAGSIIADLATKKAQVDNVKADSEVKRMQALLTDVERIRGIAEIEGVSYSNKRSKLNLDLESQLYNNSVQAAELKTRGLQIENDVAIARNKREERLNPSMIQRNLSGARADEAKAALDDLLRNMHKAGISPNDGYIMRTIGTLINQLYGAPGYDTSTNEQKTYYYKP